MASNDRQRRRALLQALGRVRAGDVAGGIRQAHNTMARLEDAVRIRPVVSLGQKALEAVPAAERHLPVVVDFDAYLGSYRSTPGIEHR
jgi:hypothetical protein